MAEFDDLAAWCDGGRGTRIVQWGMRRDEHDLTSTPDDILIRTARVHAWPHERSLRAFCEARPRRRSLLHFSRAEP